MEQGEALGINEFERVGYDGVVAANIRDLTDDLPWETITVGYYHDEKRFPKGVFVWAAPMSKDTIAHEELHAAALHQGILSKDSRHEVPPWGCRLDYKRGAFRMAERSSTRGLIIDSEKQDDFIEFINDLYQRINQNAR